VPTRRKCVALPVCTGLFGVLFALQFGFAGEPEPRTAEAWFKQAEAQFGRQEYEQARGACQRAAELGFAPARAYTLQGKCESKLGQHAQAEAAFRRALEAAPEHVPARFGLATALFKQKKTAEAIALFEPLSKRDDEWGEAAVEYLGQCYLDAGQAPQALALLKPAAVKNPDNLTLRWLLARSLYENKNYAEALPLFRQLAAAGGTRAAAARFYAAASLEGLGRVWEATSTYRRLAGPESEWSNAASQAARSLSGKPWRVVFDYSYGQDSNVVAVETQNVITGGRDFFTQEYLDVSGRPYQNSQMAVWVGAEHFGLDYLNLHQDDYLQDAAKASVVFSDVSAFSNVTTEFKERFSELAYQSFRRESRLETTATYDDSWNRLRFGVSGTRNDFYHDAKTLTGWETGGMFDYRLLLPQWDHELRFRGNFDYRWSQDVTWSEDDQRVRGQYRAQIWKVLYGQAEASYRRDDYPYSHRLVSGGILENYRLDKRCSGEIRFDAQLHHNVSINWGAIYETQGSTIQTRKYHHHIVSGGFTLTF